MRGCHGRLCGQKGLSSNDLRRGSSLASHGSTDTPVWGPLFKSLDPTRSVTVDQRIRNISVYIESLLFQVQRHDWRTYAAAVAVLAVVAVIASLIPARRGARVDPMIALRCD